MSRTWALAAALTGTALMLVAPAGLAAAGTSAQDTINQLQADGYAVTIDKVGSAPLSECTVTSVRNPQQTTQWVPWVGPGRGLNNSLLVPQVNRTISVSLDCTGSSAR
jgi:hypothetical protein